MELLDELVLYEILPTMTDQELSSFCSTDSRLARLCETHYQIKVRREFPYVTGRLSGQTWRQRYFQVKNHVQNLPYYLKYDSNGERRLVDYSRMNNEGLLGTMELGTMELGTSLYVIPEQDLKRILWRMNSVLPIQILPNVDPALNKNEFYDQLQYLNRSQVADLVAEELIRIGHVLPS